MAESYKTGFFILLFLFIIENIILFMIYNDLLTVDTCYDDECDDNDDDDCYDDTEDTYEPSCQRSKIINKRRWRKWGSWFSPRRRRFRKTTFRVVKD